MKLLRRHLLAAMLLTCVVPASPEEVRVLGISEAVFRALEEAQELLGAQDFAAAEERLDQALGRRTSGYERAQILGMHGYVLYEAGDLEAARARYREALAIDGLPESLQITLRLTLGQVCLADELPEEAEAQFRTLLTLEDQNTPANRVLLAAALLGQEDYEAARDPLESAIGEVESRGDVPRESWLSMLSSVFFALDDFESMRGVIEKLVLLYPREQYLMNLAALHGQLGETERQLALIESLLDDGRLTRSAHLKLLANLYLGEGLPHKAATLLAREMEAGRIERSEQHLELLSQAWYLSADTDRAVEPLAEAAALSDSGELFLRLARLHIDAERWAQAEEAAEAALEKGGLRQEGQAWLLRGMAEVRLEKFVEARRRFERAAQFEDTARYASQWIAYLEAEQARLAVGSS